MIDNDIRQKFIQYVATEESYFSEAIGAYSLTTNQALTYLPLFELGYKLYGFADNKPFSETEINGKMYDTYYTDDAKTKDGKYIGCLFGYDSDSYIIAYWDIMKEGNHYPDFSLGMVFEEGHIDFLDGDLPAKAMVAKFSFIDYMNVIFNEFENR